MIDLNNEYKRFNKLIFNNQLPENVAVKWNNAKTFLGKTNIYYSNNREYLKSNIKISTFYKL